MASLEENLLVKNNSENFLDYVATSLRRKRLTECMHVGSVIAYDGYVVTASSLYYLPVLEKATSCTSTLYYINYMFLYLFRCC